MQQRTIRDQDVFCRGQPVHVAHGNRYHALEPHAVSSNDYAPSPVMRPGAGSKTDRSTPACGKSIAAVCPLFRTRNKGHTSATHLLRSGVDVNTICAWLGHARLDTTMVYTEIDLEMKAKAIACSDEVGHPVATKPWREDKGLMSFLRSL